jgi:single-stranded DNA-binding protein
MSNSTFEYIGSVVRVSDLKYSPDGNTAFLDVDLCVVDSSPKKDGDGFHEYKLYPRITYIGKRAENAIKNMYKHREVVVKGNIRENNYEDSDGNKVYGYQFRAGYTKYFGPSKDSAKKS